MDSYPSLRQVYSHTALYPKQKENNEDFVIAVDSSGVKVANRGEWIRHKWKVRRGWIKVYIAVDVKTKEVVSIEVTDESVGDGEMLPPHWWKMQRRIKEGNQIGQWEMVLMIAERISIIWIAKG